MIKDGRYPIFVILMKMPVQYLLGAAAIIVILAGMKAAAGMLNPILLGLLMAMVITPLASWIIKKGVNKWIAITLALLTIILGGLIFSTLIGLSMTQLINSLPEYQEKLVKFSNDFQKQAAESGYDISKLIATTDLNPERLMGFAGKLVAVLGNFMSFTFVIAMVIAFSVIDLINYKVAVNKGKLEANPILTWFETSGADLRKYVSITAIKGVATAVPNYFLLLILGVDFALLWAVLSFLFNFIPNIGFLLSFLAPALIALVNFGFGRALLVFLGFWLINAIIENVIGPMYYKEKFNISLLTTFISMLFWGFVLGLPGTILAIPLTLVVMKLIKDFPNKSLPENDG